MANSVGSLNQEQIELMVGSLLGDGYVRIVPDRKNAFLEINHSYRQRDYVDWNTNLVNDPLETSRHLVKQSAGL